MSGTYRGYTIVSMPPPSSGGAHVIEILNILEGFPLREQGLNSAASLHEMAEAEKLAYADRAAYLGDPDFVKIPLAGLISKAYAEQLRALISPDRARPAADIRPGEPQRYESDQTTHFSIVDGDGQRGRQHLYAESSLRLRSGRGRNRRAAQRRTRRFRRQARRRQRLRAASAATPTRRDPKKRPLSSMSPTLVFKDGKLEIVTGSPGGSRIITIVLQIIVNVIDHGLNVAEAENAPRAHDQLWPDELRIERGMSPGHHPPARGDGPQGRGARGDGLGQHDRALARRRA